jgi:hypothetical protein
MYPHTSIVRTSNSDEREYAGLLRTSNSVNSIWIWGFLIFCFYLGYNNSNSLAKYFYICTILDHLWLPKRFRFLTVLRNYCFFRCMWNAWHTGVFPILKYLTLVN